MINQDLKKDFEEFQTNYLHKLDNTLLLDQFENKEVKYLLSLFYNDSQRVTKMTGSLLNSIFYNKKQTFILSKRIMQKLFQNDLNILGNDKKFKTLNYSNYITMLHKLFSSGILERLRNSTGRKAGVYKLIKPNFVSLLHLISKEETDNLKVSIEEYFEAQELGTVDYYDTNDNAFVTEIPEENNGK